MGQYRQWLHYRQVDRHLQTQKEQLTSALMRLREAISDLDTHSLVADNHIIQALILYAKSSSTPSENSKEEQSTVNGQSPEIISQVLFEHNRLSNFDQIYEKDNNAIVSPQRLAHTSLPPIPQPEVHSSLKNTDAQADEQALTEPQVALPWWLQKVALSATQSNSLDAQSVRTNRLVQRWLERWGRQEEQPQHPNADGQPPSVQQERQSS